MLNSDQTENVGMGIGATQNSLVAYVEEDRNLLVRSELCRVNLRYINIHRPRNLVLDVDKVHKKEHIVENKIQQVPPAVFAARNVPIL